MRPFLLIAALTCVAWMAGPVPQARACSCEPVTPSEAFAQADAVFEGRVRAVEPVEDRAVGPVSRRVRLEVVRSWKGASKPRLEVRTVGDEAMCGYPFEAGRSYLVYSHRGEDGHLHAGLCSRTRPIEEADEDLAPLGAGITPVDPGRQGSPPPATAPDAGPSGSAGCGSCAAGGPRRGGHAGGPLTLLLVLGGVAVRRCA